MPMDGDFLSLPISRTHAIVLLNPGEDAHYVSSSLTKADVVGFLLSAVFTTKRVLQ